MFLVGGPADGIDAKGLTVSAIQVDYGSAYPNLSEITLYQARNWWSLWPIPGWERVQDNFIDISRGDGQDQQFHWRVRNYYHPDRVLQIGYLIARIHWMEEVGRAFQHGAWDYVEQHLPYAIEEAKKVSEITLPVRTRTPAEVREEMKSCL